MKTIGTRAIEKGEKQVLCSVQFFYTVHSMPDRQRVPNMPQLLHYA